MIGEVDLRNSEAAGKFLLVCEHASNSIPTEFGTLGLDPTAREAHIAWDPGAIGLARALSDLLDSPLVAATTSRLVYDCNRPPDSPGAYAGRSEIFEVPGNLDLDADGRIVRTEKVYLPFQAALTRQLARMLARGQRPVLVTVHSFTPVWFGQFREVEFGIIHDIDSSFAEALLDVARELPLRVEMNQPYSAADGVAHTLKLHATPHGLPHAMLEIRNDLLADEAAQQAMAGHLASALSRALRAMSALGRIA